MRAGVVKMTALTILVMVISSVLMVSLAAIMLFVGILVMPFAYALGRMFTTLRIPLNGKTS